MHDELTAAEGDEAAVLLQNEASPAASRVQTLQLELDDDAKLVERRVAGRALQASHFLSTWGQRGWEFAVGLIMLELHPTSLALVAVWGLLDSSATVACGAAIGAYVDSHPRLVAASRMYLLQNSCLAGSAAGALGLLWSTSRSGPAYWAGVGLTMAAGAASTLGALGSTLSVEREWTRTLCGSDHSALASLNAVMKRIDLTCLIASPIMVGLIMQYAGGPPMVAATLALLTWNVLSWPPEVALLRYAQRKSPALAAQRASDQHTDSGSGAEADGMRHTPGGDDAGSSGSTGRQRLAALFRQQARAWALYWRQPVLTAALALALLYCTILSWGTLMTAYLKKAGLPEAELALYRGLGALSGIAATLVFPPAHRRLGLVATGTAAIWLQLASLLCGAAPAVAAALGATVAPRALLYALVWGLVLSRFGLWGYDLAANQLIQETVDHASLGAVNGVQGSLQSFFQLLAYLASVASPSTDKFVWLMAGSCCVVGLAAALVAALAVRSGCGRRLGGMQAEPIAS